MQPFINGSAEAEHIMTLIDFVYLVIPNTSYKYGYIFAIMLLSFVKIKDFITFLKNIYANVILMFYAPGLPGTGPCLSAFC